MKDKDIFKEVFSDKLKDHTAEVNPQLWSAIQSQISVGATGATAGGTTLSTIGKIIISVASVATVGASAYFYFQEKEELATTNKEEVTILEKKETEDNSLSIQEPTNSDEKSEYLSEEINTLESSSIEKEERNEPVKIEIESTSKKDDLENKENSEKSNVTTLASSYENEEGSSLKGNKSATKTDNSETVKDKKEISASDFKISYTLNKGVYSFTIDGEELDYISWDFGDGNYANTIECSHSFEKVGQFIVSANIVKGENTFEKNVVINIVPVGKLIYIPDVLTPNNDGANDVFYIKSENISEMNVRIVNQNNVLVYETNDVDFLWDGITVKGNIADQGSYMLIIKAVDVDGFLIQKTMPLTIMK